MMSSEATYTWRGDVGNAELNQLHAEAFETRVFDETEWNWQEQLGGHSLGWVVARDRERRLVGFVNVVWDGLVHAWLQDTMVATAARGRGIGVQLVMAARDGARDAGCEWLHVDFDDHLRPFYFDACGFTPTNGGLLALRVGSPAPGLDDNSCQGHSDGVHDVEVIEDPAAAAVALDPVRAQLLSELAQPASAGALALRLGIARQKLNYHLRALEAHGLVELTEERKRGGITERVLQATAVTYVVSPAALGASGADPDRTADRLSARYLVALAGRVVREVGSLVRRAGAAGKRLPTLGLDTEIRFRSAEDRAAFAEELATTILALASRYHHDEGRPHRVVVAAYPRPKEP